MYIVQYTTPLKVPMTAVEVKTLVKEAFATPLQTKGSMIRARGPSLMIGTV